MELSLGSGYQATGNTNVGHYLGGLGVIGDEPYILGKFVTLDFGERGRLPAKMSTNFLKHSRYQTREGQNVDDVERAFQNVDEI